MKRLLAAISLSFPSVAMAHGGAHALETGPAGWTFDATLTAPLLLSALAFAIGFARLRQRSTAGREALRKRAWLFAGGWGVLAFAVVSPLHEAGERSFTMHMIEHELIMLVAALLLALSRPLATMIWAFPAPARQAMARGAHSGAIRGPWRFITDPVVATILQAGVLWIWHAPPLFDRALGHEGWHIAQHLSFLVTALLFWWAMTRRGAAPGVAALCLFVTSIVGGALGALMAFSSSPWYTGYAAMGLTPEGLTPVEDQQLAGLLMWIPGGLVHAGAALWLLGQWLRQPREGRHAVAMD